MELTLFFLLGLAVVIFFLFRGQRSGGVNRCTRCDGTGQVNERWPDPKVPGGWHILEGTCPKCKGKGRV